MCISIPVVSTTVVRQSTAVKESIFSTDRLICMTEASHPYDKKVHKASQPCEAELMDPDGISKRSTSQGFCVSTTTDAWLHTSSPSGYNSPPDKLHSVQLTSIRDW